MSLEGTLYTPLQKRLNITPTHPEWEGSYTRLEVKGLEVRGGK